MLLLFSCCEEGLLTTDPLLVLSRCLNGTHD